MARFRVASVGELPDESIKRVDAGSTPVCLAHAEGGNFYALNDVCTHGATVGPVDPEHLFYLRSRGIPETTAKRMLIQGFFGAVLERIPFAHARSLVEAELEARIG